MNKSTKGAIAAAAAGVLLLGGAGTLAFWTDDATVNGTTVTSGHLTVDSAACNAADWTLDGGLVYTTQKLVPGDTLTKTCNLSVNVAGVHLTHIDIAAGTASESGSSAMLDELSPSVTGAGGTSAAGVVVTEGANSLPVTLTITWPYGSAADNDTNVDGLTYTLDDITIVATQKHL